MGKSKETFNKKEIRDKKEKKRKEKLAKKLARKENEKKGSLEDMMAYVDENGMITSTPPDPNKKKKAIKSENIEVSIPKSESIKMDPIRKGIVTYYDESKGYGFIKDSETHESVFFHVNNLLEEIKENNVVRFEVVMGQKGPTATKVKLFK